MTVPRKPKIYHILHVDRLPSIIEDGCLWSDSEVEKRSPDGTTIGMNHIKQRRLKELTLTSHPGLHVGECVPFYFCPRSVMLYIIHMANHQDLAYRGGQKPIVHLEADLCESVEWAEEEDLRWAFTLSNAGSEFFEDRADLDRLGEIDWSAVASHDWRRCRDGKQAEFLVEREFPWELVSRIGVQNKGTYSKVQDALADADHRPAVELLPDWYY